MERRRQAVRPAVLGGSPRHFLLAERHLVRRRAQQGIIAQTGERAPLHRAAVARAAPSRGPHGVELAVPPRPLRRGFRERGAVGAPQAVAWHARFLSGRSLLTTTRAEQTPLRGRPGKAA